MPGQIDVQRSGGISPAYGSFAWISLLAAEKSMSGASGFFFRAPITLPMSLRDLGARFPDRLGDQGVQAGGVEPLGQVFLEEPDLRVVGGDQVGPSALLELKPWRRRGSSPPCAGSR